MLITAPSSSFIKTRWNTRASIRAETAVKIWGLFFLSLNDMVKIDDGLHRDGSLLPTLFLSVRCIHACGPETLTLCPFIGLLFLCLLFVALLCRRFLPVKKGSSSSPLVPRCWITGVSIYNIVGSLSHNINHKPSKQNIYKNFNRTVILDLYAFS